MLCDKGYLPLPAQESQLDAPVSELPPYRVRDLMAVGRSCHEHQVMCKMMSRAVEAVRTSSGLILNTFDALETNDLVTTRRDVAVPVFDIGPLHNLSPAASSSLLQQDRGCLEWLDKQAPASVLYISFGSVASMSGADLAESAWGIANSGQPFLWVLRPDLVHGVTQVTAPDGFDAATRDRGMMVRWAPAAGGGPGARRRGRVLDALRVELGARERVRGRADALPTLLRRPDGQCEVRGARVAGRTHAGRRAREGQSGGGHPKADAEQGGRGDEGASSRYQEQSS